MTETVAELKILNKDTWQQPKDVLLHGCFGFIGGHLILGRYHHQEILKLLVDKGWTWEQLESASQVWGWYTVHLPTTTKPPRVELTFVSDAAYLHKEAVKDCKEAFCRVFNVPRTYGSFSRNGGDVIQRWGNKGYEYGGDYDRHYGEKGNMREMSENNSSVPIKVTPIPEPPKIRTKDGA